MTKEELIVKIREAFKGVKLEDGVGVWEAQGLDDYASPQECKRLREKDEKENWENISLTDYYQCNSSPSFFDAKGMRFHLPFMLLHALDVYEEQVEGIRGYAPDVEFHLTHIARYLEDESEQGRRMREYDAMRFSLLTKEQVECVIGFLEYSLEEWGDFEEEYSHVPLKKACVYWKQKLNEYR